VVSSSNLVLVGQENQKSQRKWQRSVSTWINLPINPPFTFIFHFLSDQDIRKTEIYKIPWVILAKSPKGWRTISEASKAHSLCISQPLFLLFESPYPEISTMVCSLHISPQMQHKHKVLAGTMILVFLGVITFKSLQTPALVTESPTFSPTIKSNIRTAFLDVWQQYKSLHRYGFDVIQSNLSSSTMQAQPVIDLSDIFGKNRSYKLDVAEKVLDSGDLNVADLPDEVLRGWFAHELGHIVDYENHSNAGMIAYGLRYYFSNEYKREREHEADSIAIRLGFRKEIIVAKKYLLENDFISPAYQSQIKKYYMSVRGAELCPDGRIPVVPKLDL